MTNDIKFAETVMLLDAAYVNRVTRDLSAHFAGVVGREFPRADLPLLLECLALDGGLSVGENKVQVLFIYDYTVRCMDAFCPSNLAKELSDVAFQGKLGEFSLHAFEPSDMATREDLFLESLKVVADAAEVKRLVVVPAEEEYGDRVPAILNKVDGKDGMTVFGMNPPSDKLSYQWEMLGFAILQALGVKADEL